MREEVKTAPLVGKGTVRANDLFEVTYTDKSKHHKKGEKSKVHKVQAEKLVEKGFATASGIGGKKKDEGNL